MCLVNSLVQKQTLVGHQPRSLARLCPPGTWYLSRKDDTKRDRAMDFYKDNEMLTTAQHHWWER